MKNATRTNERGVALFFSIFALLLLTAIGAALIFMASTETSVNSNYRQEQIAYFAAKAGLEESRARLMQSDPASVACGPAGSAPCTTPLIGNANYPLFDPAQIAAPTTSNYMIYYVTNPGSGAAIQPWASTDKYYDDELCHEGYTAFAGTTPPEERCPAPPGGTWYQSFTSTLPFSGTANALSYKWARIAPKLNNSANYLYGTGATPTTATYKVNLNPTATVGGVTAGISGTTPICWDGQEEVPLTITTLATYPTINPPITNCSQMSISAGFFGGAKMSQVYVVTALGVTSSGARKMVQSDVALQPTIPFPYGMFATSNSCSPPAITMNGGSKLTVDAYTPSANGGMTILPNGGDMGSNGAVSIGNGTVVGIVGVLQPPPGNGTCTTPLSSGPGGSMQGTLSCPTGDNSTPPASCYLTNPYLPPAPKTPITPNTAASIPACPPVGKGKKSTGDCITPGTWGNISENGPLTMAAGTYNVNSLSFGGNAVITVNPPGGTVVINVGGCGDATCSVANQLTSPISIDGNGYAGPNDSNANDFTINYGGSGSISVGGNGQITAIVDAPNANVTLHGGGGGKGSVSGVLVAGTITMTGTESFNFDKNAALAPVSNNHYTMVGYHELPY